MTISDAIAELFKFFLDKDCFEVERDFNKVKSMDIEMTKGMLIYIPSYWWYSIKFSEPSSICAFKYKTYMNMLTILPEILMKYMQNQNIKRTTTNKITINPIKKNSKKNSKKNINKEERKKKEVIQKQTLPDIVLPSDIIEKLDIHTEVSLTKDELPNIKF